jgi:hypothetical protein
MTTSTIVLIAVIAVAAILLIAAIAWVARNKRTQHRRVEAGDIRDKATDESHKVNRPGPDGGSGYWISTRGWSVHCVA